MQKGRAGNRDMEQGKERSRKRAAIYGGILTAAGVLMMLALSALGGGRLSLWETGFNGLLSALGIMTTLCPTARLAEEDTPEVWVRESRVISWLGGIFFAVGLPFCMGAGLFLTDDAEGRAVCAAMGILCVVAGIWMELAYRNRSIAAYRNGNVTAVTSFGRRRTFSAQEIRKVSVGLSGSLCAKNADKKVLFRFEDNMDDSELLTGWLIRRGTEIALPETKGRRKKTTDTVETQEWKKQEQLSEPKHIRAIRAGVTAAGLLAVAGGILPLFFPAEFGMKKSIFVMAFSPLLLYLCYVLFPGIVVAEKPETEGKKRKERYIYITPVIPCLLGLWNLEVFSTYERIVLQVVDSGKMLCLDLTVMALLMGILFLRTPKWLRKGGLVMLMLFALCIGWGVSYGTNLALCGKAEHSEAQITGSDIKEEDGDEEYYLTVRLDDERETELYVSEDMYRMYMMDGQQTLSLGKHVENEPLILCLRNSVFGIRMADIHLPEED